MNFSLYPPQEEEKIYIAGRAKTWHRSGLITEDQLRAIAEATRTELRQTNPFFRVLFYLFTCLCAGALVALFFWLIDRPGHKVMAMMLMGFGVIYYAAAEYITVKNRLYRHGIEEGLALMAMFLFCAGCNLFLDMRHQQSDILLSILFSVAALGIYLRFGHLYAASISVIALCVIPFQCSLSPVAERLLLLVILCCLFALGLIEDKRDREDFRKNQLAKIKAGLLVAIYLTVNLEILGMIGSFSGETRNAHLYPQLFPPLFYWLSYVCTFLIPAAAIYWGIKSRKRLLLNAGLVMACVTLATNKSYLGMTRYAWDPIILGVVLIGLSLLITRWLNAGPDQKRFGFTAREILKPEDNGLNPADIAAALTPGVVDAMKLQTAQDSFFQDGSSGGGGTSRNY
ncbi:MAG: DUF2157 domain-containing protein [Syntrophaceae bacterium]|nr:DUF2157 domain-containing protein [Syntrophaceae bacterium]